MIDNVGRVPTDAALTPSVAAQQPPISDSRSPPTSGLRLRPPMASPHQVLEDAWMSGRAIDGKPPAGGVGVSPRCAAAPQRSCGSRSAEICMKHERACACTEAGSWRQRAGGVRLRIVKYSRRKVPTYISQYASRTLYRQLRVYVHSKITPADCSFRGVHMQ